MFLVLSYLLIFAGSALICAVVIQKGKRHRVLSGRATDISAVQAAHTAPTPRVGGLGLLAGVLISIPLAPAPLRENYTLFAVSLGPVFAAGFAEDLRFAVKPAWRLAAAVLSSVLAIGLLGMWIPRVGIPGLDVLVAWAPVGILFTLFAAAGVCNAFNLIDGLNGLAAGTGVVTAVGLAVIARAAGDPMMAELTLMLVAALMGFLVFNFPKGRIFLGDAGAYSLGHMLAWFAIVLMVRVETLSPWAVVLVFFWPIADTFLAIYRRRRGQRPADQPDRLHYHQLVMRALEILWLGRDKRHLANPLATVVMMPLIIAPVASGVILWDSPLAAFLAFVGYAVSFALSYVLGLRLAQSRLFRPGDGANGQGRAGEGLHGSSA
ncbi:glycosyltransferase family 4 protein [Rhodovulum sp. YNF3179]|mgnify:CR=1 FL=1|uniref:glycosyltransferase family 4 protein n=1 Tax=Rhodovulum sp. YNF3179 TaxID=3425127 RepID=UPI003D343074